MPTDARARMIIGGALALAAGGVRALGAEPLWATIGFPGNAPYNYLDPGGAPRSIGSVPYEYQIARTEVTGAEWFEFVQAYAPYVAPSDAISSLFTSGAVNVSFDPNGSPIYSLNPLSTNHVVAVSWRYAARYVNWLNNDKARTPEAFTSGAFDTSTFSTNPGDTYNDQRIRSPGAKYWIPCLDEWIKAAYFDPNKGGAGIPGYWVYPHRSDIPPIPGPPGIGETSASFDFGFPPITPDVGAYTDVQSPWGLWDLSGGEREWLEDPLFDGAALHPWGRAIRGSRAEVPLHELWDRIDWDNGTGPNGINGLRLARAVPGVGSTWCVVCPLFAVVGRRSRR